MHAMMAVGAEKFEAQLHAADMRLHLADEIEGVVEQRRIDRDIDRVAHAPFSGAGVAAGKFAAIVFAPLSSVAIRRERR